MEYKVVCKKVGEDKWIPIYQTSNLNKLNEFIEKHKNYTVLTFSYKK